MRPAMTVAQQHKTKASGETLRIPKEMARYRNPITTYRQRKIEKNTPTIIKQRAYVTRSP
jgi:hypothetical protein